MVGSSRDTRSPTRFGGSPRPSSVDRAKASITGIRGTPGRRASGGQRGLLRGTHALRRHPTARHRRAGDPAGSQHTALTKKAVDQSELVGKVQAQIALPSDGCGVLRRVVHASPRNQPRPATVVPRKEVIQPHLPVRLPCYDFVPVTNPTLGRCLLAVSPRTSGVAHFHDVTGGVYKARVQIHRRMADRRLLATPPSWGRVAAPNLN